MKILVVYFSRSGRTKALAKHMAMMLEADECELLPKEAYPSGFFSCIGRFSKEKKNNARPEITSRMPDPLRYDKILVGFPIWGGVCPNIILSFFDKFKKELDGKDVYPFCTHINKNLPKRIVDYLRANGSGKIHGCMDGNIMNENGTRLWLGLEPKEIPKS